MRDATLICYIYFAGILVKKLDKKSILIKIRIISQMGMRTEEKMKNLFKSPRALAFLGLMLAITIIMSLTPLGFIPLGVISATITHIPTIITGIVLGPVAGLIMGTSFGIVSLINAITRPVTILDPLFMNPLVSVLPRMFIGVVSYYIYSVILKLIKKPTLKNSVGAFIGGMAGSLTNTVLVFLMLYVVYATKIEGLVGSAFGTFFASVLLTSGVAEAIISGIITTPVILAYSRYKRTSKK